MTLPPLNLSLNKETNLGPNNAEQTGTSGMFDSSNWNVNFGGTQTNANTSGQRASTNPGALETLTGATGGGVSAGVWLAVFGIIAAALIYKKLG